MKGKSLSFVFYSILALHAVDSASVERVQLGINRVSGYTMTANGSVVTTTLLKAAVDRSHFSKDLFNALAKEANCKTTLMEFTPDDFQSPTRKWRVYKSIVRCLRYSKYAEFIAVLNEQLAMHENERKAEAGRRCSKNEWADITRFVKDAVFLNRFSSYTPEKMCEYTKRLPAEYCEAVRKCGPSTFMDAYFASLYSLVHYEAEATARKPSFCPKTESPIGRALNPRLGTPLFAPESDAVFVSKVCPSAK
ncbi:hypothetical protein M3Y99_01077600 [Aphelenchoides fujianensis]|nr:hypothetical protein M3Y99_01077600 [Aphelenchoides fujianensis]